MQATQRQTMRRSMARRGWLIWAGALALVALGVAAALLLRQPGGPLAPSPAAALLERAADQRPVGRTDQLIWSYQEIVRAQPNNYEAKAILGAAYLQKARETGDPSHHERAETLFDEALRSDPQQLDALIGKGSLALARHQFGEALELGERTRATYPMVPRVYGLIADAQIELGMYDQALESIQTMVDMRPDLASYSRVAYARELHGDLEGAIEAMRMAVNAGGPSLEHTEWTRAQLGQLLFNTGDLAAAEQEYQISLSRMPDYVYALAGLARVRAAQGNDAEAVRLYEQAIARMPLAEFVIALGELHEAAGREQAAAEQYALVGAIQQLVAASGTDTDLELALFAADHGDDPQAALALAEAAYARRPGIKGAETLAWALFKAGRSDEARTRIDEAMRLGTRDPLLFYRAGMIAQAQGDSVAARDYLAQALALNPAFSPLFAPLAQQALAP